MSMRNKNCVYIRISASTTLSSINILSLNPAIFAYNSKILRISFLKDKGLGVGGLQEGGGDDAELVRIGLLMSISSDERTQIEKKVLNSSNYKSPKYSRHPRTPTLFKVFQ